MKKKVLSVFGTRPEAIKMAPLVLLLSQQTNINHKVCVSAQHREMLDQVLQLFHIKPDYDLDVMKSDQNLHDVTSAVLLGMRRVLDEFRPDLVLVHGDTTTCFAAALAAFYAGIDVGHVEAGLRTHNMQAPFPEEANRSLVGKLATYHFAPTKGAKDNLLAEGADEKAIVLTGNTVIDALLAVKATLSSYTADFWEQYFPEQLAKILTSSKRKVLLITGHRRENFGQGFIDLCQAIRKLAENNTDVVFVYPVHLNPNVQKPVRDILSDLENVFLTEPLDYLPFTYLMNRSYLLLTDSGGIQEEAPSLGKPVLVMREVTERPEAVVAGTVRLVGTDQSEIIASVQRLIDDPAFYNTMANSHNPYGDGKACQYIVDFIQQRVIGPP